MNELAALLTAIGGLVTAIGGTFALVWTTVRTSKRERESAAPTVAQELADAMRDGDLTADELEGIAKGMRERGEQQP